VHLFGTGSATQIGEGSVIISDTNDVDDLLEAIIRKFPDTAGQEANKLVVRPTRHGEPLKLLRTKLSTVQFECDPMTTPCLRGGAPHRSHRRSCNAIFVVLSMVLDLPE